MITQFITCKKMKKLFLLLLCMPFFMLASCSTDPTVAEKFSFDAEGNTVLEPPPAGEGLQIQIPAFDVPLGAEVQRDFYITLPNLEGIDISKIEIAMNEGTHHMNLFRSTLNLPDTLPSRKTSTVNFTYNGKQTSEPIEYNDSSFTATSIFNESDILIEAQISGKLFSWDLPTLPSGKQSIIHLEKNERMILQVHYVNATTQSTQNSKGKVSVNIWYAKGNPANYEKASMMFARNMLIKIEPLKADQVFQKNCEFAAVPRPMYILGMTGHFHSRGKRFIVDKMKIDPVTFDRTLVEANVYVSNDWGEPPFTAYANPVKLDVNEYIRYTCVYDNPTTKEYKFGPKVETSEHANLFAWFTPSYLDGKTLYDAN